MFRIVAVYTRVSMLILCRDFYTEAGFETNKEGKNSGLESILKVSTIYYSEALFNEA